MQLLKRNWNRWGLGGLGLILLAGAYSFQGLDYSAWVGQLSDNMRFVFNKSTRFLLNDVACLLLISAFFNKSGYLKISAWIFLLELIVLLPLYFALKLSLEGDSEISSPLLSQLHRMIVNPLLMLVLIMGFVYQDYFIKKPA